MGSQIYCPFFNGLENKVWTVQDVGKVYSNLFKWSDSFLRNPQLLPRDIENDKTGFYLVLPPEFKEIDSEAEVVTCFREGRRVSYKHTSIPGSIKEGEETVGGSGLDSWVRTRNSSDDDNNSVSTTASKRSGLSLLRKTKRRNANDDDDNNSVSTTASKKSGLSLFRKKKRVPAEQEVVYLFRVLLDGNEKFIWLQAAAELGRLTERAVMCHVPFDNVIK